MVENVNLTYHFANRLSVSAKLPNPNALLSATLYMKSEDRPPFQVQLPIARDGTVQKDLDLTENVLTPFARVYYWFQLFFRNGQAATSAAYWFDYNDNRFDWRSLSTPPVTVYWTGDDTVIGQLVMDVAQRAIQASIELPPGTDPARLRIYAYSHASDLPALGRPSWADGHAIPSIGVILLSVDGRLDELGPQLERQIPHELTHIRLFQATGEAYSSLPNWLVEGLAVNTELYPNPEYEQVLRGAAQVDGLFEMQALCNGFPTDGKGALLAYAQSASFVGFLQSRYGNSGIAALLQEYADYRSCDAGLRSAFGKGIDQLQADWLNESLHVYSLTFIIQKLLPYVLIVALSVGSVGVTTWAGLHLLNRNVPPRGTERGKTGREK